MTSILGTFPELRASRGVFQGAFGGEVLRFFPGFEIWGFGEDLRLRVQAALGPLSKRLLALRLKMCFTGVSIRTTRVVLRTGFTWRFVGSYNVGL